MESEQLNRANEIIKELRELSEHHKEITNNLDHNKKERPMKPYEPDGKNEPRMYVYSNFSNDGKKLKIELLPIELITFMQLYIMKIEDRIKELEIEFEKL